MCSRGILMKPRTSWGAPLSCGLLKTLTLFLALCGFFVTAVCQAVFADTSCPRTLAPGNYPLYGKPDALTKLPENMGIKPEGFVIVHDQNTVDGVDVSKWQDYTDFRRVYTCGGRFAYIRLSAGLNADTEDLFLDHWSNARSILTKNGQTTLNPYVGGYHFLTLVRDDERADLDRPEQLKKLIDENRVSAQMQARLFLSQLYEVLQNEPAGMNTIGQQFLPPALVLALQPQPTGTASQKLAIGQAYGTAACAWIDIVKRDKRFSKHAIMVFTSPSIFAQYGLASNPCILQQNYVWLYLHTLDGDRAPPDQTSPSYKQYAALCLDSRGNDRCIIQQYTSFGNFASFDGKSPLDLDRFYGTDATLQSLLEEIKAHP
jgi:GH25 family lysozyme M1 (1,4-beta-N-acetylmuramidase)